jgi:chemotaxis protein CheC
MLTNQLMTEQLTVWPGILNDISTEGILHTAIRHVAYNLSEMIGRAVKIDRLTIETIPINRLESSCLNPESEAVGIYLLIDGDLSGESILVFCPDDAMYLADWLLEVRPGTTTRLGDIERSALAELGNQALSSFLNAIADLTGAPLRLSPPAVIVDMLGVIFEAVAMSADTASDDLLIIKTSLVNTDSSLRFQFWVIPDLIT